MHLFQYYYILNNLLLERFFFFFFFFKKKQLNKNIQILKYIILLIKILSNRIVDLYI